jgi:PAS domain S-box-containing protein
MFVAWGSELGFLYNDSYAEILGAKHPRALGIRFYDIWSEIWADISPLIDAALAGQASYRENLPLVMNRKGYEEKAWFTFSYSPVRDERGKVAGMFCAVSETTPVVLAQRELRELNNTLERRVAEALAERKLLADIVEGTNAFVQVADLGFRWLAINRASADEFQRIFGKRPKVGDNMLDLLAERPESQAAVREVWSRALAGEEFIEIAEFGDPGLDRRAYEMRFSALRDRDGKRIGAYQFVYDVTDRLRDQERLRHAEDALRQAQKMESIGQLTGGIAHDFNNLLAVMSGGLQVLERSKDPAQHRRVIEGMHRAVKRGAGLTSHLLAFSRRRPVNAEPIDMARHIQGMSEMLSRSLRGDIRVDMKFAPDLWPVEADAGEMELAILNLCVNARDAMREGGTIAIMAENQPASEASGSGDFVKLTIADVGRGMAPDVLARAFEPFFTTKEVGHGSGLGLAQVYGFAVQSGGKVSLKSEVGGGTVVTLLLPRSSVMPLIESPAEAAELAAPERRHRTRRGHVLLVEDDREVAALTIEMLGNIEFEVTHVTSAAAALGALADGRPIDVVFSDVMMPGGMNGRELAHEIKRRWPAMTVVLTTGYAGVAADIVKDGYILLRKPYRIEALEKVLNAPLSAPE